jgi:hypothetical protein
MALRDDLQKKIDRKLLEIHDLENQVRQAQSYIQALEDTLKMLPREGANEGQGAQYLRPQSAVAKAHDAIRKAGKPLHITELLAALGKATTRANRAGLSGSLAAYVRKGEIFTRPAPNTYGLADMQVSDGFAFEAQLGPPSGFGRGV